MAGRARLATAVVAVLALLACVGGLVTGMATPASAQVPGVRIQIDSVTPYATKGTKTLRVTGRVVNSGDVALSTVNAMLWFDQSPLTSRDELATAASEQPGERLGTRLDQPWNLVDQVAPRLRPHASARFDVKVPLAQLGLSEAGVYVVGVDIRATTPNSSLRETWRARTFLPYLPAGTKLTPVEVAFVLPVTDQPRLVDGDVVRGSATNNDTGETPALGEFAPGGRLSRLIDLGADHDLSFLVDPSLLDEARRMSDGFTTSSGTRVGPAQTADVRRWLNRARGVLASGDAKMLPYADPDLPALQRYHLTDRFPQAVRAADQASDAYQTGGTLVWPGAGYADAGTLETIAASKAHTVLLSQRALPALPKDGSSPVASLATPEGAVTALVADPSLTAGGPGGQSSPASIQQRFLSETALAAMQGGDPATTLRRMVAAMPRDWNPGSSGDTLFRTVESVSWLRPLSVGALLSQAPTAYGGPLRKSPTDTRAELSPRHIQHLRDLAAASSVLLDMLAEPERSRPALDREFLRGASTSWRRDDADAIDLIDTMTSRIRTAIGQVEVVPPRLVTLSSQTGRFPVTIWNRGSQPVEVRLEVRPRDPELLEVAPIDPVRVDPNRKATVSVTAQAPSDNAVRSAVQMEARVTTRSGTSFGATQPFFVRVTGYGQVGWVVIFVGLGLLLLAAGTRIVRRLRAAAAARRATAGGEGRATTEGDESAPQEQAPGDPARPNGQAAQPPDKHSGTPPGSQPGPLGPDMTKAKR
nr:DUF6049 family protein [Actinopolymorpha cephalotaxi]